MKNFVLFRKKIVFVLLASCSLLGCGKIESISKETQESLLQETASEIPETSLQETVSESIESAVTPIDIDVQGMLEEAEEEASALQKKLTEDAYLKQSDMNVLSSDIYLIWDDLLNEIWSVLENTLDEKTMNTLLEEQRVWITEREEAAKKAGDVYGGGSMAVLAYNMKAAEWTKLRVYELAEFLDFDC